MSTETRRGFVIYRRNLDNRSGTGQLVAMQAEALRAAGHDVTLAARRGRLRYFLRTGSWPRRMPDAVGRGPSRRLIVDHSNELESADVVFVHNSFLAASAYLQRSDWDRPIDDEARFFGRLGRETPIVANSDLIKQALVAQYGVEPARIEIIYPGYCSQRFRPELRSVLGARARAALGIAADERVVGLIASGDLLTRGLPTFLDAASTIARALPRTRFVVVGSKRLPDYARTHRLARDGRLLHRPKSTVPQRWLSAFDVFLHTSLFDAYGMVVTEALALGVPTVTSTRCGVAERLLGAYRPFVLAEPDAAAFAAAAIRLLADPQLSATLVAEGSRLVAEATDAHYGRQCVALIERSLGLESAA